MQQMTSGQLDKRVVLVSPSVTQDAAGGPGPDTDGPTTWACIDSLSGTEMYQGQFVSDSTHKVTIRYRPGITPNMKVRFGSRKFNILFIANAREHNDWLDLFCQELL